MRLNYRAVTKEGKTVNGIIEAKDAVEAGSYLRTKGFLPIKIQRVNANDLENFFPFLYRIKSSDIVFFTRQLSSMLTSGLTLMQALTILRDQVPNKSMQEMLKNIITDMEDGRSFSQAIAKYPEVFSTVYIALMQAAEQSGLMDKITKRLADNLEKQQQLKSAIKGALMYPAIVVIGMIGVLIIMMVFVVPQLTSVYKSLNVELPLTTQAIIALSAFITNYWPVAIGGLILFILLVRRFRKSESGKRITDAILLRLPIFGKLIKESILTEFTRTFGILVSSGTLVVEALLQTSKVVGNGLYQDAIVNLSHSVEKGVMVSDAMEISPLFPPMVLQMVKIGEQTGKLDESLLRLSDYYDREVTEATKTLTTALEPIILVILGGSVGFMIIAIITPIYSLINSIK